MAPPTPYPVSGILYDVDGSTALEGATVWIENYTNSRENASTTTDSNGEFMLDLANLTTAYADGDQCYLIAQIGQKSHEYSFTIATATGYEEQDMFLAPVRLAWDAQQGDVNWVFFGGALSNSASGADYVTLEARGDRTISIRIDVGANTVAPLPLTKIPLRFPGGIRILASGDGDLSAAHTLYYLFSYQ